MENLARLHLIEKKDKMKLLSTENGYTEWESGYWWRFKEEKAKKLIGGSIYFHKSQNSLSHTGGTIVGYRKPESHEKQQTLIFIYRIQDGSVNDFINVPAQSGPWEGGGVRQVIGI